MSHRIAYSRRSAPIVLVAVAAVLGVAPAREIVAQPIPFVPGTVAATNLWFWDETAPNSARPIERPCGIVSNPTRVDLECAVPGVTSGGMAAVEGGGVLRASSQVDAARTTDLWGRPDAINFGLTFTAAATLRDRLTFGTSGGAPAPLTARFHFLLDGAIERRPPGVRVGTRPTGLAGSAGLYLGGVQSGGERAPLAGRSDQPSAVIAGHVDVPVVDGGINLFMQLLTTATLVGGSPVVGVPTLEGGVTVDFSHTARINGLQLFGALGPADDLTSRVAVTSAVGVTYALGAPTAVPEPGTWTLLGAGLLALAGVAARRAPRA